MPLHGKMKSWNLRNVVKGLTLQELNFRNISAKPEAIPVGIPSGDYKYIQTAYQGNETVGSVNIIVNVNSPDKQSFGWGDCNFQAGLAKGK